VSEPNVIPIGGRGRPGRGAGTSPSAAARALSPDSPRRPGDSAPEPPANRPPGGEPSTEPKTPRRSAKKGPAKRSRGSARTTASKTASTPAPQRAAEDTSRGIRPPRARKPVKKVASVKKVTKRRTTSTVPPDRPGTDRPRLVMDEPEPNLRMPIGEVIGAIGIAARDILGSVASDERVAEFLAFLRRRIAGEYAVDEFGFDREITERFLLAMVRPIAEKWFRVEVRGVENIPPEGGALLVANHSGTVPIDGLITSLVVHDHARRFLRLLAADLVFTMPFVGELARKGGATMACNEDAERMLAAGELVGVYPEGFKGVGKPYSERYKLQRFGRGGFVSAALRARVPIVPCSIVGAEEIYPLVGNIPILARLLGVPYIPVTPFFPWLGPLGMIPLPSKWLIEFGEPVRTDIYAEGAADDPMLVFNVTDQVRETIQQTLYTLLISRRSVFF
jgi:1-acyl-sn-glycerol-3-phosphate acyltransferase